MRDLLASKPALYWVISACAVYLIATQPYVGGLSSHSLISESARELPTAGFAAMIEAVKPAVIGIRVRAVDDDGSSIGHRGAGERMPGLRAPRFSTSEGSGFFITSDGYAVTNYHVIKGSTVAELRTDGERTYKAKIVSVDRATDLALLKVDGRDDFAHVQFSDVPPRIGDWIVAIGNPFGLGGTVTAGIVSARGRDLPNEKDLLQIDAPVNRGNSGGPTFDLGGRVVGVNTMIISPTGGSVGLAFAIPSATVKRVVEQLKDKGSVTRGWLGIQFQSVSPEIADSLGLAKSSGVVVADVGSGSPGAKAGIAVGDVVHSMNGRAVENANAFNRMLDDTAPGTTVALGVIQNGCETFVDAVVGDTPAIEAQSGPLVAKAKDPSTEQPLGLSLVPAGALGGTEGHGAVVIGIDPGGLAAGRGIGIGDVILDVANQSVATPQDVYRTVADAGRAGKQLILMRVKSGETAHFISLPID